MRGRAWDEESPLTLHVRVQGIVDRKLPIQPLFIGNAQCSEALGDGAQADTLGCGVLLAFYVGGTDDEGQPVERWVTYGVVFENSLERAARSSMIQLNGFNLWCIKRNCILQFGLCKQVLLVHKKKFCLRINESFDQPGTGNTVYLDVPSCDPFHVYLHQSWLAQMEFIV